MTGLFLIIGAGKQVEEKTVDEYDRFLNEVSTT